MRGKIFKWLFNKEWIKIQKLSELNAKRQDEIDNKNINIGMLNDKCKEYDVILEELKKSNKLYSIGHTKNIELRDTLYNYISQVKSGNLYLEENNYGIGQLIVDENIQWEVDTCFCQIGGCTISTEKFKTKSCAEVFASIMTLLGEEPATSLCSECRAEYNKTLL